MPWPVLKGVRSVLRIDGRIIQLKDNVAYTQNLFGTIDDLKKGTLRIIEKNPRGDCLCIFNNSYLVDVDHRDIKK